MRVALDKELHERLAVPDEPARNGHHAIDAPTAVVAALVYADLFDYPLTMGELYRFQVGTSYGQEEISRVAGELSDAGGPISVDGDYYSLRGREGIFNIRPRRERASERVWRRAHLWSRWMARTPFVRMIAVTGALSMNNLSGRPDIDLLVVTEPGRVWVCRRLLVLQVRLARLFGDDLCPNYILSTSNLQLDQRDFFTAHELAQMVPLKGEAIYRWMLGENFWARQFLPAAFAPAKNEPQATTSGSPWRLLERLFGMRIFDRWEGWELRRLRAKLAPIIGQAAEVVCSPEQCKGHTGLHRASVLARYGGRLRELGIDEPLASLLEANV
ncbi:MAG TPA: hypothetical protein VJ183_02910 [Chloroflexia bacterium]|nr:hypothetical protein [Chloroflexia bacterium]